MTHLIMSKTDLESIQYPSERVEVVISLLLQEAET
jgi:hypothetical protein